MNKQMAVQFLSSIFLRRVIDIINIVESEDGEAADAPTIAVSLMNRSVWKGCLVDFVWEADDELYPAYAGLTVIAFIDGSTVEINDYSVSTEYPDFRYKDYRRINPMDWSPFHGLEGVK